MKKLFTLLFILPMFGFTANQQNSPTKEEQEIISKGGVFAQDVFLVSKNQDLDFFSTYGEFLDLINVLASASSDKTYLAHIGAMMDMMVLKLGNVPKNRLNQYYTLFKDYLVTGSFYQGDYSYYLGFFYANKKDATLNVAKMKALAQQEEVMFEMESQKNIKERAELVYSVFLGK